MPEHTIAIVEDEEELRENLQDLLEFQDYKVVAFVSAEELLTNLDTLSVDLLLLDYQLPGMSGLELLPIFKEKKPDIPVAMVTASCQQNTIDEALLQGAARVLGKPYTPTEMMEAVKELLQ